ncbi:response regulator [Geomonas nitrogeniifigens]|uniref:histidine kinase n=2 Tax=Geomonas diazotrophica TaxID=2843197 RepID=A0ABX8JW86_9BACT|nr:response regulator [Geomonas nitrogeniifigens]QXE88825.1 response regulator [Geomonas nitrogeniifigens]
MEYGMFSYPVHGEARSLYQELVLVNRTLEQKVQELNRAQQRLMEYRKVFECTGDLIYVFDRDYRYLMANEAYLECRRSRFPDLIGRTLPEVIGEETFARIKPQIDACFAGNELSYEDSHHYADKGKRHLLVTFSPVFDGDRVERVACLIKDVSERKLLEEQLRQSQKMEAVGTLAGGIAHDFNNILTVIAGYASLIQINTEESETAAMAGEIMISVERAAEMTRSLLAFSRKQEVHLETVDLNQVVAELHKSLSRLISEEIELVVRVCGEELCCLADRGQLEQVLINLAVNARDAMPGGGVLDISTGVAEPEGEDLPAGRCAVITVSDNGTGMDKEVQERVFEPFFTTKEVGKGTGLGLSSSYGIIKKHNGAIRMQSAPGAGTSFSIYLPLSGERPCRERGDAEGRCGAGSGTVLLVEDEETVRNMTRLLLERHGYRVLTACNGQEALELFRQNLGSVQLLLSDVVMPRMNGRELCERVRQLAPGLPVIFMSGYPADVMSEKGIGGGGAYLQKPVKPEELLGALRQALIPAGGRLAPPG